ncbi:hypothetical protein A3841_06510 [Pontibacter flavimaris]|uniref:Uncharacterized protein n=1 Tax=Pontibacter flavimaris TaxID=1797110 RepID=A0A1Q5P965_9BACT|nr:hypothetical protein A3841_06510 [Pontibacter flavimaris]
MKRRHNRRLFFFAGITGAGIQPVTPGVQRVSILALKYEGYTLLMAQISACIFLNYWINRPSPSEATIRTQV